MFNILSHKAKILPVVALCAVVAACSDGRRSGSGSAGGVGVFSDLPPALLRIAQGPDGACGMDGPLPMVADPRTVDVERIYRRTGFDLNAVRLGGPVPGILLADLPDDLGAVRAGDRRKVLFLKALLPAVLYVNHRVAQQRAFVRSMKGLLDRGGRMSAAERARYDRLADCYGVEDGQIDSLLVRVDGVPPALALAQAAVESGWGTSRFAQDGNALFGQRTRRGKGLTPEGVVEADFRVRSADHLLESVAAYLHNLNTHPAYRTFRVARAAVRRAGEPLDGTALAATLDRYSERGMAYVDALRTIIRGNRLAPFDSAALVAAGQTS
jgi:Bax protein